MFNPGDRVKIKRVFGKRDRPPVGHLGTIKGMDVHYLVETDEYSKGHNGDGGVVKGKDGHCWWVKGTDLEPVAEEVSMSNKSSVEDALYRRFVEIKGIGPEKARRCAQEAIKYLDGLVASVEGGNSNEERDEDGIKWVQRPGGMSAKWKYFAWAGFETVGWLFNYKPQMDETHNPHNWFIDRDRAADSSELSVPPGSPIWDEIPDGLPLEERIVRLYG